METLAETGTETYAHVAVDQPLEGELTYRVPAELRREAVVGARVTVPLGRGNRLLPGTIMGLTQELPPLAVPAPTAPPSPAVVTESLFAEAGGGLGAVPDIATEGYINKSPVPQVKDIHDVLREVHPVPADLLALARWVSSYYCCPIGQTLSTMVPAAVKRATRLPSLTFVHLNFAPAPGESPLAELEKTEKLSPKTRETLLKLLETLKNGPKTEAETIASANVSKPVLKRLSQKGIIRVEKVVQWPSLESEFPVEPPPPITLSADQSKALAALEPLLNPSTFAVRLIHGVTGSGKTELYIRAIEQVVAAGKRAIVLVPEISLTPQAVRRFTARFPRVAVLHSGLRDSQRHQHWHAIASGWAQVIVGARSAIFAPAENLGLIVVDEEHDPSYKQDNAPKYQGRDVAIRRAQMLGIPVLLGSATPALESWHNAHSSGKSSNAWGLLSLPTRPTGTQMPRVVVVDMKEQSKERRGLHILSTHLEHQLKQTLERKKQAIFLLNRRGYAHYVSCPRCDWVLMCNQCDATMVVHRSPAEGSGVRGQGSGGEATGNRQQATGTVGSNAAAGAPVQNSSLRIQNSSQGISTAPDFHARYSQVQCHYCLTSQMLPAICPQCKAKLSYLGQDTQRAEDELARKFPQLRLARMDSDSMRDAADYQRTLDRFGAGELDLLLGTQMISKGLDFPQVALVGVLNADLAMTVPDFRASERTFQLICQVAGRSGRSTERGTVVVQTFQPQEPAIVHACNHDYLGFVQSELPHREQFGYPPFGRMVRIVLSHKGFTKVQEEAAGLLRAIEAIVARHQLPIRWHGPQPPPMERLVENYRVELLLFSATPGPLQRLLAALRSRGLFAQSSVTIAVDVDPVHML